MPSIKADDELAFRVAAYSVSCDLEDFFVMPKKMYEQFRKFHGELRLWSASGSIDWNETERATFIWGNEYFLPIEFINTIEIKRFRKIGIVYSADFVNGYIFKKEISRLPLDIMSLSNAPAFGFGIDEGEAKFSSLLELRWPSTFIAKI